MVGRPGKFQPRFTSGELDALIQQNTDLHIYATGASHFENVLPLPQGGFRNRWGTKNIARIRSHVAGTVLPTNPAQYTAPYGGNPMGAVSGGAGMTTNALPAGAWLTIWQVDLSVVQAVSTLDLYSFSSAGGGSVGVQVSADNVKWAWLGPYQFGIDTAPHTRRFSAPVGAPPLQMRWLRVMVDPAVAGDAFSMALIGVGYESGSPSTAIVRPFTFSTEEAFDVVFTDGSADIYGVNGWLGSVPTPYSGQQLSELNLLQKVDTMLCFHEDVTPGRLMRQGSDVEWNFDYPTFTNLPNVDLGGTYTNAVPAAWDLGFFGFTTVSTSYPMPSGGAHYTLTISGQTTPVIQHPDTANPSLTISNMIAGITALTHVRPGFVVFQPDPNGQPDTYRLQFSGAGNEGDAWSVSGKGVDKGDTAITAAHTVVGKVGGEPIMSSSAGWPACGQYYSQRLLLGGFRSRGASALASVSNDFFNCDTSLQGAEAAMLLPLDTQGAEQIINMHIGRNLIFFTDEAEYYLYDHVLDATVVPTIVLASRNGLALGVEPVENESKTIYTQRNRGRFFEFGYSYPDQNYISTDMSVGSSSLVTDIIDDALRKSTSATDVNTMLAVRNDGEGLMLTLLRGQDITSYARHTTDGRLISCDVNGRFEPNYIMQRQVNGAPVQFLEREEDGQLLDCAMTLTLSPASTVVTGLADYEGAKVWTIGDGYVSGPYLVSGGAITMQYAATNVTVGRWTAPDARTLPQPRDVAPHTVVRRPARVHTVRMTVVGTTSVAVGANDQGAVEVPLMQYGGYADRPPNQQAYTGEVALEGIYGFSKDAIVQITQTRPGFLTVTGITVEVDL